MKVKALIDCVGIGYDLKKEDVAEVKQEVGEVLVNFGYVEEIEEESYEPNEQEEEEKEIETKPKRGKAKKESDE